MKILILMSILCGNIYAQTNDDLTKWQELLQEKDLPEIAGLIEHSASQSWPKIISHASQAAAVNHHNDTAILGDMLFEKIRAYEKKTLHQKIESTKAISVYISLSLGLQNSGGYVNLCLSDAVNRLALGRLIEILVNQPSAQNAGEISKFNLICAHLSTMRFVQMIYDEPAQKLKPEINLSSLKDETAETQILAALNLTPDDIMSKFGNNQASTSNLLHDLQIGVLLSRMIFTDAMANLSLGGLIEFLKRGGRYDDLNPGDIRPFKTRMNGNEFLFKSKFLSIDQVRVSHLLALFQQFHTDEIEDPFVKIALQ